MASDAGGDWKRQAGGFALACLLAAAGFLVWSWPLAQSIWRDTLVLPPATLESDFGLPPQTDWNLILNNDQTLSLWGATENARSIVSGDWSRLVRQGQCWPMPSSAALGEHMIDLGILAAPWWIATHDPVASYNLMFATALVVGAAGMFLFLFRHTGSMTASLVGALAFAFATPRLVDLPYHPAVVGTHWIPWLLWSFDRSLAREGWGSLAVFGVTLLLSGLVGSYPLIAVALAGGAYGAAAFARAWRRSDIDPPLMMRLAAAALPAVFLIGALLGTYAGTHASWLLQPNAGGKFVVSLRDYLPGGLMSVGAASIAGLVPLVFVRGAGSAAIAGLVLATAAGLAVATAITTGAGESWSIFEALADVFPLLDSVRAPGKAGLAVCFAVQALGAIGWARLFAQIGRVARIAVAAALVAVMAIEIFPPELLRPVLGGGAAMQLRVAALEPRRAEVLVTSMEGDPRPVLDLPLGRMVKAPLQLLDAAYHGHETSACYNSLVPPTMREAYALVRHTPRGVAELAAAGFGFVVERAVSPTRPLQPNSYPAPAELVAFEEDFAVWRLPLPGEVHHDVSKLSLEVRGGATRSAFYAPDPPFEIDVDVTNRADVMWALGDPPAPLTGEIELVGNTTLRSRVRGVLPLALEAGQTATIQLVMFEEPPAGNYRATVTLDGLGAIPVSPAFTWAER